MTVVDATVISGRLTALRERISRIGGERVQIIGVTKTHDVELVRAAMAAGITEIGENYAQETVAKLTGLDARPTVHFIGQLQRNKVRKLVGLVDVWQTIDRIELGAEIAKRDPGARVMVQVDISGEDAKGGCLPADTGRLVDDLRGAGLDVIGLMGVGLLAEAAEARPGFRLLRSLVDELGLVECSMGMSGDLDIAVEEGSTMVRVGTGLFGHRQH
ncbi:MAG: YggS family pyridoxal phosphate-dependent enzyme [Actinobacteria bacterium]|nr:YggS family pyridoxal phosphate-dependent enzyme [Actinomycetota bacterium]